MSTTPGKATPFGGSKVESVLFDASPQTLAANAGPPLLSATTSTATQSTTTRATSPSSVAPAMWPPTGTNPYYADDHVCIYHGDCREILPLLPPADLVLTDPPYGIAATWVGGWGSGWARAQGQAVVRNEWDVAPPTAAEIAAIVAAGKDAVVWGGNYFVLPPARWWLVWNKPERNFSLAEAELAWTTRDNVVRVFDYRRSDPGREHPTQKPLDLMRWCLGFFPDAELILDPFMGSGTTLRAAKDCGRRAIGVELDERYCEIAAKRMGQEVLAL